MKRRVFNKIIRPERKRRRNSVVALPAQTSASVKDWKSPKTTALSAWEPKYTRSYDAVYPMDKNLLFRVLSVQSETGKTQRMHKFIEREIAQWANNGMLIVSATDAMGNLYVIKGDSDLYPTVVTHTDTVHDIVPSNQYQVRSNGLYMWAMDPTTGRDMGIGGDDKVGIFITLSMLRDLPVCKAVFFVDEEIGCVGSNAANMAFFDNSSLVLQCDRRDTGDFVDNIMGTPLYGRDFEDAIAPLLTAFGYTPSNGGMTDVWQLKENGLDVCAANMSCGYFMPHTRWETIGIHDVQRCYDLVQSIMEMLGGERWPHVAPPRVKRWTTGVYSASNPAWLGDGTGTRGFDKEDRTDAWWNEKLAEWRDVAEWQSNLPVEEDGHLSVPDYINRTQGPGTEVPSISSVSLSQLLQEDQDIIATARAAARYYPPCPKCQTSDCVIMDDGEEMYWCLVCDMPVQQGWELIEDDSTKFPTDGARELGVTFDA